eukprot:Gb_16086 [translate_table: standard]
MRCHPQEAMPNDNVAKVGIGEMSPSQHKNKSSMDALIKAPSYATTIMKLEKRTMQDRMDTLEQQHVGIKQYLSLMQEYKVSIPEIEHTSYQMMGADFVACKEAMITVEESKVENVKIFSADLVKQMEKVKVEVASIRQLAKHDMILDDSEYSFP